MNIERKALDKSQIELTITVPYEDVLPQLEKASHRLSSRLAIPGFRKGQVPFSVMKTKYPEAGILEEAANDIVVTWFVKAVQQEHLETIGQPKVEVKTAAPGNPFVFTATVAMLSPIQLPDLTTISVTKEIAPVTEEDVDKTLEELRKMRATDSKVDRAVETGDRVITDFIVKRENVPIEGGSAKLQPVVIGEQRFIPGFEEQLIGMKAGASKIFDLTFPQEYHEKTLAGKPATFEVTVQEVREIKLPELNEEFAKSMGEYKTMDEVRKRIRENLVQEHDQKATEVSDMKIVNALIEKTSFGELPEVLFTGEVEKMLNELKTRVMNSSGKWEDYLSHLSKTEDQLKTDLRPDAEKRVKTGLAMRQLAMQEKIQATDAEIQTEVDQTLKAYASQPDLQKQFTSPQYRDYVRSIVVNRKVFELLRQKTLQ